MRNIQYKSILIFLLLFSCINPKQSNTVFNSIKPQNVLDSMPLLNTDTTAFLNTIRNNKAIMIHYFDGNCSSCIGNLNVRKSFVDSFFDQGTLGLIFIANTSDTVLLNYYLIDKIRFEPPVLYDYKYLFKRWNKAYIEVGIETFMVDQHGRILVAGDPIYDEEVKLKYIEKLK